MLMETYGFDLIHRMFRIELPILKDVNPQELSRRKVFINPSNFWNSGYSSFKSKTFYHHNVRRMQKFKILFEWMRMKRIISFWGRGRDMHTFFSYLKNWKKIEKWPLMLVWHASNSIKISSKLLELWWKNFFFNTPSYSTVETACLRDKLFFLE